MKYSEITANMQSFQLLAGIIERRDKL